MSNTGKEYELQLKGRVLYLEAEVNRILRNAVKGDWQSGLRRLSRCAQSNHFSGQFSIPEDLPLHLTLCKYSQERNLWNHKVWAFLGILWQVQPEVADEGVNPDPGDAKKNIQLVLWEKGLDPIVALERKELLLSCMIRIWEKGHGCKPRKNGRSGKGKKERPDGC